MGGWGGGAHSQCANSELLFENRVDPDQLAL